MKKRLLSALFVSSTLASSLSVACSDPGEPPAIPDPTAAVTAQMVKANNEVKAYVQKTEEYLACANLPRSKHNKTLDDLKAFADEFNTAIRTFKAKNG
jgi:hypothetical protein